jgi:hypothetical protein
VCSCLLQYRFFYKRPSLPLPPPVSMLVDVESCIASGMVGESKEVLSIYGLIRQEPFLVLLFCSRCFLDFSSSHIFQVVVNRSSVGRQDGRTFCETNKATQTSKHEQPGLATYRYRIGFVIVDRRYPALSVQQEYLTSLVSNCQGFSILFAL